MGTYDRRMLSLGQPNVCWPVFMVGSSRSGGLGRSFGYLKPEKMGDERKVVMLVVMPYDYYNLHILLTQLCQALRKVCI